MKLAELEAAVATMMEQAWRPPGFCVPNSTTYPHQCLWDSCFHSVIWQTLGDKRGLIELSNVLAHQEASGFVPHMTYWNQPGRHESFWGRAMTSTITQPPMFGHAARRLTEGGQVVPDELTDSIGRGIRYLLFERPRTSAGLIPVVHPWETGCDDSPRWDSFRIPDRDWRHVKGDLVQNPKTPPAFAVGSVGFNALVVWNTWEYLQIAGGRKGRARHRRQMQTAAEDLAQSIRDRWRSELVTWADDGPPSGRIRTLDALLALLVDRRREGFDQLQDPGAFGAPFGPRGVHRHEESYRPNVYWRGPAWPQLSYLLWIAATNAGRPALATELARCLTAAAAASGLAEYCDPETGQGLGACPQSWAGLALVVARAQNAGSNRSRCT